MNPSSVILKTPRLILRTPTENDVHELQAFEERNQKHLAPWRSPIDPTITIKQWMSEFAEGRSIRFLLYVGERLVGLVNFTQIFRGPFQACYLGYYLDAAHEGKGLMTEALKSAILYMFEEQNIHRIRPIISIEYKKRTAAAKTGIHY